MTRRAGMRTSSDQLWRRVIARLTCGRRLARPRVPLVFVRRRSAERGAGPRTASRVAEYRTALHVHITWPQLNLETRMRPSPRAITSIFNRMQVSNLALHHHLQRQAFEQKILVARPSLIRTSRSPLPAQAKGALARRVVGSVARRERAALSHAAFIAPQPETARTRGVHRVARPTELALRSGAAPESSSLRPGTFQAPAGRRHFHTALVGTPRSLPLATKATIASSHRAIPVTFVRLLATRVRQAHQSADAATALTTALRSIERISTRTNVVTHVVHARMAHDPPVPRVIHHPADERTNMPAQASSDRPAAAVPLRPAAQPVIDVARLSDEVYRHIQRRVRIERERRGA